MLHSLLDVRRRSANAARMASLAAAVQRIGPTGGYNAQVRLEGLEPDPAVFAYVARYICDQMSIEEAVAVMIQRFAVSERGDGEADGGEPHS